MGELTMVCQAGREVRLYDHDGDLVGIIASPLAIDPLGGGRETVYLARVGQGEIPTTSAVGAGQERAPKAVAA